MPTPPSDEAFEPLTVQLGGRAYPLRVLPEDAEPIRSITKELNDKLAEFQQRYTGRDKQDCLAMLLLIYSVDLYKVKQDSAAAGPKLIRSLTKLERELGDALAGNSG